jgi:hypothetical protein
MVVQIQDHEAPHLLALLKQAQRNLASHNRYVSLAVDRDYVDGPTLYAIDQLGITWMLMAKLNQAARATALALSAEEQVQERTETLRTRVISVQGICTWDRYHPLQEEVPRLPFADRPALNGVVIQEWRNNLPDADTGPWVLLTNGPVDDPWVTVNAYDERSWIENGLFRNSKQFWTLVRWFPQKDEARVRTHLTFVMLMLATATAYRLWDPAQSEAPEPPPSHLALPALPPSRNAPAEQEPDARPQLSHASLEGQGRARWRRELRCPNRDKLSVFVGEQYGIFDTYEFLVLTGVPLRQLPPHCLAD